MIISPRSTERKIEVITAPAVIIKRELFSRSPPQTQQLPASAPRSLNVAKVNMAFSGIPTEDRSLENPYAKIEALAKFKKQRLTERVGNPIHVYLKKRDEMYQLALIEK